MEHASVVHPTPDTGTDDRVELSGGSALTYSGTWSTQRNLDSNDDFHVSYDKWGTYTTN